MLILKNENLMWLLLAISPVDSQDNNHIEQYFLKNTNLEI